MIHIQTQEEVLVARTLGVSQESSIEEICYKLDALRILNPCAFSAVVRQAMESVTKRTQSSKDIMNSVNWSNS